MFGGFMQLTEAINLCIGLIRPAVLDTYFESVETVYIKYLLRRPTYTQHGEPQWRVNNLKCKEKFP